MGTGTAIDEKAFDEIMGGAGLASGPYGLEAKELRELLEFYEAHRLEETPLINVKVEIDPSIPAGEVHVRDNGKEVGRIVNIATPSDVVEQVAKAIEETAVCEKTPEKWSHPELVNAEECAKAVIASIDRKAVEEAAGYGLDWGAREFAEKHEDGRRKGHSKLVVTKGGVPYADQAQGIRDFHEACKGKPIGAAAGISDENLLEALRSAQISDQMQKPWVVTRWKDGIDIQEPTNCLRRFAERILKFASANPDTEPTIRVLVWDTLRQCYWRSESKGYTDKISEAGLYSLREVVSLNDSFKHERRLVPYSAPKPDNQNAHDA